MQFHYYTCWNERKVTKMFTQNRKQKGANQKSARSKDKRVSLSNIICEFWAKWQQIILVYGWTFEFTRVFVYSLFRVCYKVRRILGKIKETSWVWRVSYTCSETCCKIHLIWRGKILLIIQYWKIVLLIISKIIFLFNCFLDQGWTEHVKF